MDPLDIRTLRANIIKASHMGERIDGKQHNVYSTVTALIRHSLAEAEYAGLNGEDTMTLCLSRVAVHAERLEDMIIDTTNRIMNPPHFITKDGVVSMEPPCSPSR